MCNPYRYYTSAFGWQAMMRWYTATLSRFPPDVASYSVTTRFGPTHILEAGQPDAPPLLLVHGSNVNALGWRHQLTALSVQYRVLAPDIPGFAGRSVAARLSDMNDDYADWLVDLMDSLGVPNALLAGSSSGGAFVMRCAARCPERCAGIALLNPAGIVRFRYPYAWFRNTRSTWLLGILSRRLFGSRWLARRMVQFGAGNQPHPDTDSVEMAYLLLRYFRRHSPPPILPRSILSHIHCPLLLLVSDNDPYLNPHYLIKRAIRLFPQAEVHRLPGTGHDMHRDYPDLINDHLTAFAETVFMAQPHRAQAATQNHAPDVS